MEIKTKLEFIDVNEYSHFYDVIIDQFCVTYINTIDKNMYYFYNNIYNNVSIQKFKYILQYIDTCPTDIINIPSMCTINTYALYKKCDVADDDIKRFFAEFCNYIEKVENMIDNNIEFFKTVSKDKLLNILYKIQTDKPYSFENDPDFIKSEALINTISTTNKHSKTSRYAALN